jgi:hypothetical protein
MRWVAGLCAAVSVAAAQSPSVTVTGPVGDPLREGTPRFTISTSGFTAAQLPLELRLQVAFSQDFSAPFFADTTVSGTTATIVIPRLLLPLSTVWWRAIARTAQGTLVVSNAQGPRRTSAWVHLIAPNNLNGTTVTSTRPAFQWSAVRIHPPVQPWRYTVVVTRASDGFVALTGTLTDPDSVFVPFADLEANTPYRWSLSAVAGTGDSIRVVNASSFVIASPNAPIATVMFQPFPTPFPTERLNATCIWFDLRRQSEVTLEVLDLRGNHVAHLIPRRGGANTFAPGRYGRVAPGSDTGCDDRFTWHGTDDSGRLVRPGVYLVRFTGDGSSTIKRVLFRGR